MCRVSIACQVFEEYSRATRRTIHSFLRTAAIVALSFQHIGGPFGVAHAAAPPPITSSGLNTVISPPTQLPPGQTSYSITGGTRPGGGTNVFHSFGNFSVPNNNIANFLNESGASTSNILGRVTGGNPSNIFGTIQTTGFGNANLFLMNPAGFLFGPNATVNVGGMVTIHVGRLSSVSRQCEIQRGSWSSGCVTDCCAGRSIRVLGVESRSDYRSRQSVDCDAGNRHFTDRRRYQDSERDSGEWNGPTRSSLCPRWPDSIDRPSVGGRSPDDKQSDCASPW